MEEQTVVQEAVQETKQEVLTHESVAKLIAENVATERKEWQSRFDKLLAEKKQESSQKLTVEQRLEQIEGERQKERTEWARKEARAKAGIDDQTDQAINLYLSSDPEKISDGAARLSALWADKEKAYKDKITDLETRLNYGSRPPSGGNGSPKLMETLQKEYNELMAAGKRQEANAVYIKMSRLPT